MLSLSVYIFLDSSSQNTKMRISILWFIYVSGALRCGMSCTGADEWILLRRPPLEIAQSAIRAYHGELLSPHPSLTITAKNTDDEKHESPRWDEEGITIGITSCRRLPLYLKTLEALEASQGADGWSYGGLIKSVIVVDDMSSNEERSFMQASNFSVIYNDEV